METFIKNLKNGIKCLLVSDPISPKFTFTVQIKAGSRFENEKNNGVAHLLEHMIFKGTKKNPDPKVLAFKIENLGAQVNAWTSKDLTSYYISCPKHNWEKGVELLTEMVKEPIFTAKEFEKEKKVVAEEIKMYEDEPQEKVYDLFIQNLFKDNPLGKNIAGNLKTLSLLKASDCSEFIDRFYTSKNLLLIVSGPFDVPKVINKLEHEFSDFNQKQEFTFDPFNKTAIVKDEYSYKKDLEQTHIVMGSYSYSYKELIGVKEAFYLGRVILSGGFGSKLKQRIREDLALSYYIDLGHSQFEDIGYYALRLGVDQKNKEMAVIETEKVLKDFINGRFTQAEVDRARNYLIGNMIMYFETSSDLALFYAKQLQFEKKIEEPARIIDRIKNVKKHEIIDIWKPILQENKLHIFLGPR